MILRVYHEKKRGYHVDEITNDIMSGLYPWLVNYKYRHPQANMTGLSSGTHNHTNAVVIRFISFCNFYTQSHVCGGL